MTPDYILHYAPDNASLIVRLALEELGVAFKTRLVDRGARAQASAAYLQLNPHGLIPVLETPDGPIFETGAILLWLADRHGRLAPSPDDHARAAFLKWLFFVANTLHPALRMMFYAEKYAGPDEAVQISLRTQMQGEISRHLDRIETAAGQGHGWLNGKTPSILDLYLGPCLRWLVLYPLPEGGASWFRLADRQNLLNLCARLETRACVKRASEAEGLGLRPFTAPDYADPPEGSAT
ncbi:glutathione S-transferase family protein [Roseovarius aestuariivivens]|uniref:glutathione S-transferase family protein n=1 Tax=Roseovarius aestuariivivens TaxID=1888910 RepID=UPI001080F92B|nr:glutathione S-transferase family protein [Roseovarius aestuariivivens]